MSLLIGESYGRKEVIARHVLPYSIGGRLIERREKNKRIKNKNNEGAYASVGSKLFAT